MFDDAVASQLRCQHFPGVGLHFKVRTEVRIIREQVQCREHMITRGFERWFIGRMQREVKMDPPFGQTLNRIVFCFTWFFRQRFVQVCINDAGRQDAE